MSARESRRRLFCALLLCVLSSAALLGACAGQGPVGVASVANLSMSLGSAAAAGAVFAPAEIPPGRSAIYIYRDGQFSVLTIPVRLNGSPWVELRTGGFAVAIVEPGPQEIAFPERLPALAVPDRAEIIRNTPERKLIVHAGADTPTFVKAETRRRFGQPNLEDIFPYVAVRDPAAAAAEIVVTKRSESF